MIKRANFDRGRAETAERLAALVDSSDDAIIGKALDGTITSWNSGAERIYGYTADEVIGKQIALLVPPGHGDELPGVLDRVTEGERLDHFETVRRRKDGGLVYVSLSVSPIHDASGAIVGASTIARDVTAGRKAEAAIIAGEARARAAVEAALDCVVTIDHEGTIIEFNPAAEATFGRAKKDAIGKSMPELLIPPRLRAAHHHGFKRYLATEESSVLGKRLELAAIRADGTEFPIELTITRINLPGAPTFTAYLRDITEQREAEEAVRRLAAIVESSYNAIVGRALDGTITSWNAGAERLFGYSAEEMDGQSVVVLFPGDGQAEVEAIAEQLGRGERVEFDAMRRRKDGTFVEVASTISPIVDHSGAIVGAAAISHDIGARRRLEGQLRRLNTELEQRVLERTAELGDARAVAERASEYKSEFLSRMSHELRTPLNAILGFGQLLELEAQTKSQSESVDQILQAGRHLLDLINEVLDIASIEAGKIALSLEPVELRELAVETIELLAPLATEGEVEFESVPTRPAQFALADRQRLKQVLLNLFSNAIKYNRQGGRVTVEVVALAEGRHRIAVTDQGLGVEPAHLERLFDSFDRLNVDDPAIEGTGLGLALSKALVEAMEGSIGVETDPGRGTLFWLELPGAELPTAPVAADPDESPGRHAPAARVADRTVLHIEDNPPNLRLAERALASDLNPRFISALQGSIGIELARGHQPDLILLDLHLPDMAGEDALLRLKSDPSTANIPVIVITADASPEQKARVLEIGAADYLVKPTDISALVAAVTAALAASGE